VQNVPGLMGRLRRDDTAFCTKFGFDSPAVQLLVVTTGDRETLSRLKMGLRVDGGHVLSGS
jgi:hypothetical protein